jgi:hypothetical protein
MLISLTRALSRTRTVGNGRTFCVWSPSGFTVLLWPQLKAALAAARKQRCHVAVAKLDRLSRDVHFISGLMAHRVPFLVAELGPTLTRSCCTCSPP